jgi:hypothetical protein
MKKITPKKRARNAKPSVKRNQHKPTTPAKAVPTNEPMPVATETETKGTKKDIVIRLLQRDEGATLQQLMSATGWQAHSVRGFISGSLRKKLGLTITRVAQTDGDATYRLSQTAAG